MKKKDLELWVGSLQGKIKELQAAVTELEKGPNISFTATNGFFSAGYTPISLDDWAASIMDHLDLEIKKHSAKTTISKKAPPMDISTAIGDISASAGPNIVERLDALEKRCIVKKKAK